MASAITPTACATAPRFWRLIASAIQDPIPGRLTVVSPTVIASEATTKNQPPDIDIIVFQIKPGAANGTSSRQNRSQGESWKWRQHSSRSDGTVRSDW